MIAYIDAHKERFGVEPICEQLPIAPSTYYAARLRPPSARAMQDEALKPEIRRVHRDNFGMYGARKVWLQPGRERIPVARCTVARLMSDLGLRGVRFDAAVLRDLFQVNVLALLLRERFISTELVERMREWRHSGFHAYAGEEIPDIEDALRVETGWIIPSGPVCTGPVCN